MKAQTDGRLQRKQGGTIRDGSIDAGLICLSAMQKPGQIFSCREIAFVCGVSHGFAYQTELRALRKLRERLRRELSLSYSDLARHSDEQL